MPVLIAGGGLAGLTAGYLLQPHRPIILEKEKEPGGLCRTFTIDGFSFDCTGHLLHFKRDTTRRFIEKILPASLFREYHRKAYIYIYDRLIPYPFQINLHGLPSGVVYECLYEFIQLIIKNPERKATNFREWILSTFGNGIARHFMIPYNEKFWRHPLDTITTEWVSWSIPRPSIESILKGALGIRDREYGYNPVFWYPEKGGIARLPGALGKNLQIYTGEPLTKIYWKEKVASTASGKEYPYVVLISTIPLPRLISLLDPPVPELDSMSRTLQAIAVLNYNLGIRGKPPFEAHWLYFPEHSFPFYRVGFASQFSSWMAPKNTYSLYVETSLLAHEPRNPDHYRDAILEGLLKAGLIRDVQDIVVEFPLYIYPAYVLFNKERAHALPRIFSWLEEHDIFVAGRYGEWDYYSMDDTIASAMRVVEKVRKRLA